MAVNTKAYKSIAASLQETGVTLVAVSKLKPVEDIMALYHLGQRDFGENYVQELADKSRRLPTDIRWHFIGHLQSNKVKFIAPFVHLIHGIDSYKLLKAVNKEAVKNNRIIPVLLQLHIAKEETKYGLDENGLKALIADLADAPLKNICVQGLMGMASFTEDAQKLQKEFSFLKAVFDHYQKLKTSTIRFEILSMGMSADYKLAITNGSTMVRIGSLLFGRRDTA